MRIEHNLREKTLTSDFRWPNYDVRHVLARLCALTGRSDEARQQFEEAHRVLDEQGARPLRAITDFDEAWMEVRRGRAGNRERALALLDGARGPFESIGISGCCAGRTSCGSSLGGSLATVLANTQNGDIARAQRRKSRVQDEARRPGVALAGRRCEETEADVDANVLRRKALTWAFG